LRASLKKQHLVDGRFLCRFSNRSGIHGELPQIDALESAFLVGAAARVTFCIGGPLSVVFRGV
jgi:hypothetical protein